MRKHFFISSILVLFFLTAAQGTGFVFFQESNTTGQPPAVPEPVPGGQVPTVGGSAVGSRDVGSGPAAQRSSGQAAREPGNGGRPAQMVGGGSASSVPAAGRMESEGAGIGLKFESVPINRVINSVMQELGYSYIIDPEVQGEVSIYTSGRIPREELFEVLEQLLMMNSIAIVEQSNGIYAIVPIAESPTIPHKINTSFPKDDGRLDDEGNQVPAEGGEGPVIPPADELPEAEIPVPAPEEAGTGTEVDSGKGVITYIIPLNYIVSEHMLQMAQVFLTPGATVVDFQPGNILMITDHRKNVEQVMELVSLLDTDYFKLNRVELIPIRYHQAISVAEDLAKIFSSGDAAAGVRIVAIERLNSLLVVTRTGQVFEEVQEWINKLDVVPSSTSNIKTYVYDVENNTAVQIAQILAELYRDGYGMPSSPTSAGNGTTGTGTTGTQNQQGGTAYQGSPGFVSGSGGYGGSGYGGSSYGGSGYGGYGGSSYGGYGGYGGSSYGGYGGYGGSSYGGYGGGMSGSRQLGPQLSQSSQSQIRGIMAGNVKMVVNEFSNALIIQGSEADIQFMLGTIEQLDTLPRQVFIEAQIFSVELTNDLSYGISAFLQEQGSGVDGTTIGPATTASVSDGALSAITRIAIGGERELQTVLNALKAKTDVELLEAPRVLAKDGTVASINIGAEVPVTSASYGDPLISGSTNFVNSISYRSTGTTLQIVPRISSSGIVSMDLVMEVSNATGTALTPTINRNYIQTSLIVGDGQTIGLGGIISDTENNSQSRVPLLGDIPILGALFGKTEKSTRRFEMVIFITPHVVKTLPSVAEMTLEFKRALKLAYPVIDKKNEETKGLIEKRRREEGLDSGNSAEGIE